MTESQPQQQRWDNWDQNEKRDEIVQLRIARHELGDHIANKKSELADLYHQNQKFVDREEELKFEIASFEKVVLQIDRVIEWGKNK